MAIRWLGRLVSLSRTDSEAAEVATWISDCFSCWFPCSSQRLGCSLGATGPRSMAPRTMASPPRPVRGRPGMSRRRRAVPSPRSTALARSCGRSATVAPIRRRRAGLPARSPGPARIACSIWATSIPRERARTSKRTTRRTTVASRLGPRRRPETTTRPWRIRATTRTGSERWERRCVPTTRSASRGGRY